MKTKLEEPRLSPEISVPLKRLNKQSVYTICEQHDIFTSEYYATRTLVGSEATYYSQNLIVVIKTVNGEPHHITIFTTIKRLEKLSQEDINLVKHLLSLIPKRTILDKLFGGKIKKNEGAEKLKRVFTDTGLDNSQIKKATKRLTIETIGRGNINLIWSDQNTSTRILDRKTRRSKLRRLGKIICYRLLPAEEFYEDLLTEINR